MDDQQLTDSADAYAFGATVRDAGGGVVELIVDRDTPDHPERGGHVTVTVAGHTVVDPPRRPTDADMALADAARALHACREVFIRQPDTNNRRAVLRAERHLENLLDPIDPNEVHAPVFALKHAEAVDRWRRP